MSHVAIIALLTRIPHVLLYHIHRYPWLVLQLKNCNANSAIF